MSAFLQVVHPLAVVAFAHFLADQPCHHALHPLLSNDGILCRLQSFVVIEVDTVKGGWDRGFGGFEGLGLWRRHDGQCAFKRALRRSDETLALDATAEVNIAFRAGCGRGSCVAN